MKFCLITFGCQMNKSDSERIAGLLLSLGWQTTKKMSKADLIIINTCSVRQTAEDRIFGQKDNFTALKKKNPCLIIAVTGCMPGRDKNGALRKKAPWIDLWFPIKDLPNLPQMLSKYFSESGRFRATAQNLPHYINNNYLCLQPDYQSKFQAFVPIQTGCNHFCAYCVVPFSRGREICRPVKDILKEIRALAKNGCLKVTLLGQSVNHYLAPDPQNFSKKNPFVLNSKHKARNSKQIQMTKTQNSKQFRKFRNWDLDIVSDFGFWISDFSHFAALLWEINKISRLQWIDFTAPHPFYMDDEIINALTLPKQVNYLHLPVQSGDNEILKKMNRRYTAQDYLKIIKKIRAKKPNIALGTDIIVGFCGETKKQFRNTVKLYKKADFDISYHAMYSPRSGTVAYKTFKDDVSQKEKKRRWQILQNLMEKTTLRKNQKYLDKIVEVLVEKELKTSNLKLKTYLGNSREMKLVRFKFPLNRKKSPLPPPFKKGERGGFIGKIVKIKITQAKTWVLEGKKV